MYRMSYLKNLYSDIGPRIYVGHAVEAQEPAAQRVQPAPAQGGGPNQTCRLQNRNRVYQTSRLPAGEWVDLPDGPARDWHWRLHTPTHEEYLRQALRWCLRTRRGWTEGPGYPGEQQLGSRHLFARTGGGRVEHTTKQSLVQLYGVIKINIKYWVYELWALEQCRFSKCSDPITSCCRFGNTLGRTAEGATNSNNNNSAQCPDMSSPGTHQNFLERKNILNKCSELCKKNRKI